MDQYKTADEEVIIFLPKQSFKFEKDSNVILLGYMSAKQRMVCVSLCSKYDQNCEAVINSKKIYPVGVLMREKKVIRRQAQDLKFLFTLEEATENTYHCKIHDILKEEIGVRSGVVILYDTDVTKNSFYFLDKQNDSKWCEFLVECNLQTQKLCSELHLNEKSIVANFYDKLSEFLYSVSIKAPRSALSLLDNSSITKGRNVQVLGNIFYVFGQLRVKYTELCRISSDAFKARNVNCVRGRNTVWRNGVDVLLGLCVMLWLTSGDHTAIFAEQTMYWADNVASELKRLLNWMMGVPAGLKLNRQLDQFLGNFFLYHIYLWTGYLCMLKPVLANALWYICLTGVLGLSVQIALLQDLISMMTVHIYCFYVYAARLYSLQVHALSSLWRLFRGKKWNVLRQRVDSAHYDVDQLFVGTLLFTILLFLLPTTALYYVVFTGLRLLVLTVQGCLSGVVSIINNCPVYFFVLSVASPSSLADEPEFSVLPTVRDASSYTQYRTFQLKRRTWGKMLADAKTIPVQNEHRDKTDTPFLKKLVTGRLIYPWLELT